MDLEVLPLIMLRKKALVAKPPKSGGRPASNGRGRDGGTNWEADAGRKQLDPTMNPTFTMMDKDGSNSVDQDEWSAAAKQKLAIAKGCKASDKSWCPRQNNPDDPEC